MRRLLVACLALAALAASAFADNDVAGVVTGKMLTLTGDAFSNYVTITPGGATDAFTVTGVNGTTVNGAAAATFLGVRSVTVAMGAGDDRVDLTSLKVRGNVKIRLDDGNDSVYFTATSIRGKTFVRCGAGTDTVRTDGGAIFYGSFSARGDAGNDELQVVNAQFRSRLHVEGGNDDDHVLVQSVVTKPGVRAEVFCGHGLDLVELLFSQFGDDVFVDAGPDNDRVRLAFSSFALQLSAFGGTGADDVLSVEGGNSFTRPRQYDGFEEGQPL
jgi:hypothetical protein